MLLLPSAMIAQDNSWERSENSANSEAKYLAGAVPEVNGKVVFQKEIAAPGKTKAQIYDILLQASSIPTRKTRLSW